MCGDMQSKAGTMVRQKFCPSCFRSGFFRTDYVSARFTRPATMAPCCGNRARVPLRVTL